jgi:PPK2 family polyphosphate:nucleotide phosphotransferase
MTDRDSKQIAKFIDGLRVKPGSRVTLAGDFDPGFRRPFATKADGAALLSRGVEIVSEYQARLAAQDTYGVLVVIQGIDASGKDGTIRHVMSGVNPQGVSVHSFKVPSEAELAHDYLWRYAKSLPARGQIGIFNRSHYEEVLVVRVHQENLSRERMPPQAIGPDVWKRRYREINDWERYLADNGIVIVKLFLNLSKEEQRIRFLKRIDVPDKNWKFSASDVRERASWDAYQSAFSDMLSHTSTSYAPWYVIPADRKWYARTCVSAILAHTLMSINPQYPALSKQAERELEEARDQLEAEAPSSRPRPAHGRHH